MSNEEKIALAKKEVEQAETLLRIRREELQEWVNLLDLRRENLRRLEKEVGE